MKQDPCTVKGSIELFNYINKLQTYKLKHLIQQSQSLDIKKKKKAGPLLLEDFLGKTKEKEMGFEEEMNLESNRIFKTQDIPLDHSKLPDSYQKDLDDRFYHQDQNESLDYDSSKHNYSMDEGSKQRHHDESILEKHQILEKARLFKIKFREIFAKKIKLMAQNEVLKQSYLDERRKLDYTILRDNFKNQATQNMLNKMYPDHAEVISAKPQYKFI